MNLSLKTFYKFGMVLFLIMGVANLFTNSFYWDSMISSSKVSAIASNFFNFVIALFFYSLLKNIPKDLKIITEKELDKLN